jgi:hypothetical protein
MNLIVNGIHARRQDRGSVVVALPATSEPDPARSRIVVGSLRDLGLVKMPRRRAADAISQKLTRPDGGIRASRVDRRRGSGGVSADQGCVNPDLGRACSPIGVRTNEKVQADLEGPQSCAITPSSGREPSVLFRDLDCSGYRLVARGGAARGAHSPRERRRPSPRGRQQPPHSA